MIRKKTTMKAATKESSRANRRAHVRIATSGLLVTERSGEFEFVVNAGNISEGGIYLTKRLKTTDEPSRLRIHFSKETMDVLAQPIHDEVEVGGKSFGTGYGFIQLSPKDSSTLRQHLGDLN
ncbi:MAG: PilZ domain-containing protein [Deltaproteobacteria bacterium]|nr:PilZ domain-containing protein [Deltaproteobacteria bacterium]